MFQLYDNPASPFCRKVQVVLRETGQLDEVEAIFAVGHPLAPEQMPLVHNPLGKIPCLIREDGTAMYDSRVITRFLDERGKGGLYPEAQIWDVLTLEAMADGIMDAAVLMIYESRTRPEEIRFQGWVDAQWGKILRALDMLESRWMDHLRGTDPTIGQIAVGCALGYIDFRHGSRDWRTGRDALAAWFTEFGAREAMAATAPSA